MKLLLLLLLPFAAYGQQLDDVVTSAAEIPASGSDGSLMMWTLGELMVEYYPNGPVLDQGYLQLRCLLSPATEAYGESLTNWNLSLWPNPIGDGQLNLRSAANLRIAIFDSLGRLLKTASCSRETINLDLSSWPAGSYWLRALDEEGRSRAVQIQKF